MAEPDVLIVGAGPTGLLLAVELRRRGVPALLVDAHDAPNQWDRATVVHARSAEIFEALGIVDELLERGVQTRGARFHSGGEELGMQDLGPSHSLYGFDIGVSEEVTEALLTGCLEALGGEVTRATRVLELSDAGNGITATLERAGERSEITVPWVVGCDGLRSTVRDFAGIGYTGTEIADPWAVFDAAVDGWDQELDVATVYLDIPAMILTPLPGGRWRVYLRPRSEDSDLLADATEALLRYKPGATFAGVENPQRFQCHSRVADRFRAGRVLLAGDAAHACSPIEGHGMNTGMQDAFNLGWKLALVCLGVGEQELLDSYGAERRPVAQRIVETGQAADSAQGIAGPEERAARDREIRAVWADPDAAHHESAAGAELDRTYDSEIVVGDRHRRLGAGDRLPDGIAVSTFDEVDRTLCSLTHRVGHTLFVLGGPDSDGGAVERLVRSLETALSNSPVIDEVFGFCTESDQRSVGRIDADALARMGVTASTILVVRPDRYVGLRTDSGDPVVVTEYVERLTGRSR